MKKQIKTMTTVFAGLGLTLGLIFTSCKKDMNTTPNNTTNNTSTPPADGSLTNATQFYGIFTCGSYTSIQVGGSPYTYYGGAAYFTSSAQAFMNSTSSVKVNKVYLNADTLTYTPILSYYTDYNYPNMASATWSVNGANGIGTFSMTHSVASPSFVVASILPDSISLSTGFSATISNVSNFTGAYFKVFASINTTLGTTEKALIAGNNVITVTPADLASLPTSPNGVISINLENKQGIIYSSKAYSFSREAQYNKKIKIKP
jgi:hypothetical protein